jgi:hypothetical protein
MAACWAACCSPRTSKPANPANAAVSTSSAAQAEGCPSSSSSPAARRWRVHPGWGSARDALPLGASQRLSWPVLFTHAHALQHDSLKLGFLLAVVRPTIRGSKPTGSDCWHPADQEARVARVGGNPWRCFDLLIYRSYCIDAATV